MDPWSIGLVALVVVGLAVIVYGALSDRAKNRRRAAAMLAPPQRDIPRFRPDAPAPHYLSELQARRAPETSTAVEPTAEERAEVARQIADAGNPSVPTGYASRDFVTDPTSGWAVLEQPAVLVCEDGVDSLRELLPILEKLILSRTPLVVLAPSLAPEVVSTLEVNAIRRTMSLLAVLAADEATRNTVCAATHAVPTSRTDRQSGYLAPGSLGRCARWISTKKTSHLVSGDREGQPA